MLSIRIHEQPQIKLHNYRKKSCSKIKMNGFYVTVVLLLHRQLQFWILLYAVYYRFTTNGRHQYLTCYLLPYLYLAIFITLLNVRFPIFLRTGIIGVIKSLLFALLIVYIGGIMEKNKLKLKI